MRQWPTKSIGDVCQIRGGGTPSKAVADFWRGDVPWASSKDVKSPILTDTIDHISSEAVERSSTSVVPKGSVLIVVRSGILLRTVPIAIAGRDMAINQDLKALMPNGSADSRFVYYFLQSRMALLLAMVGRSATVHRLMIGQIRSLRLPMPPLPEQRRVVAALDEALGGVAKARENAEKSLRSAHAIFDSQLDCVFTWDKGEWGERRLGEIATFRNGINFTKSSAGENV